MKKIVFVLLPIVFLLQGCSRQENFVITNETQADIIIEYEVEKTVSGFPIFNNRPLCYPLKSDGAIYWNETVDIADLDTAALMVKVILPPNKGLIIGTLSNDIYTSYTQYFINGRHFNLKNLKITSAKTVIEIVPKSFDNYFFKQENVIACKMK